MRHPVERAAADAVWGWPVDMHVEPLVRRVVDLIEGSTYMHLDSASVLSMLALILTGAGLVTARNLSLGGLGRLPLLVAEPFPHVGASVVVVAVTPGTGDSLTQRLRHHARHPSADALVVAGLRSDTQALLREIDGVPVRAAILRTDAPARRSPGAAEVQ